MARSCYLLFFFLAIQGCMFMSFLEDCDLMECRDYELRDELERIKFLPTTEEQLVRLCPPILKVIQCLAEGIQECIGKEIVELSTSDDKQTAVMGQALLSTGNLIIDICTPGTEIRENYLASISCFKDLVFDAELTMKCYQQGHTVYATYEQSKAILGNSVEVDSSESEEGCMTTAYTLACFASEVHDTCGEVARKTFVEAIKRFQSLKLNQCTEADINSLKTEFLDFLELEEERRSIFSSIFESKKRRK